MKEKDFNKSLRTEMIAKGYPQALIGTELSIQRIADLSSKEISLPLRRVDIVCWQHDHLLPLILIECKLTPCRGGHQQLKMYNYYLQAPYTALACPGHVTLMRGSKVWELEALPSYKELSDSFSRCGGMVDAVDSKSTP